MTREEHYIKPSKVTSNKGVYYHNKAVDKCFDDFESRTCKWRIDEDTIYSTACHNMWEFTEGDLSDNEIKFCPYCGSKIVSTDTKGEEDGSI